MKQFCRIVSVFIFFCLFGCENSMIPKSNRSHQEVGERMFDMEIENSYLLMMEYPMFSQEILNNEIINQLKKIEVSFKENAKRTKEQEELNITYESYFKDERYISVAFHIYEYEEQTGNTSFITMVYDTSKDVFISIDELFEEESIYEFSALLKEQLKENDFDEEEKNSIRIGSAPIVQHFQNYVLMKDGIKFYFDQGKLLKKEYILDIEYAKLTSTRKFEKEESVFVPYDQVLNEPVRTIDPNRPMVAFTFDDGPNRKVTTKILDVLKAYDAVGTFFILGSQASAAPDLLQRMVLEGSEIGNHTYSHKQLTTLSKEAIEQEIFQAQETIYEITHIYPVTLRPPYGSRNDIVLNCAKERKIVTWSIDTEDWRSKNRDKVVEKVMNEIEDGSIVLFHDIFLTTADAVEILIPKLLAQGYQFVTVSEMNSFQKGEQYIF